MSEKLIETIFSRRSIRKYTQKSVSDEDIKTLLEAAMAAPSASNRKPWHFAVTTEREKLDRLAEAHQYAKMLFEAPLCISVCGDEGVSSRFWVQDCSAATENILLAATALGLGAVWIGVHPSENRVSDVKEILGIPEGVTPLNLISIGHPAEEKESRTQYEESRVHREKW
ncbi:MAG: nitroreductase family protein [Candidatus Bathyarchaeota archaeon]|nr:MAG: nitroreductase family protein [Candidatus Bathyarchaeota archaeon]